MLVHPQFNPVALHLGPLAVRWYGLMYLVGFALIWMLGRWRIASWPGGVWTAKVLDDALFYGILGTLVGGRLGYVLFYKFGAYLAEPWRIFFIWEGGMSFHGGFLGVPLLSFYAAGLGVPFLLAALFTRELAGRLKGLRRFGTALQIAAGLILVAMGIAMITGQLSSFAFWLLRIFPGLGTIG